MKKDFLTLLDFSKNEIESLLELSKRIKSRKLKPRLKDKTLLMLFEKTSTRTRVSFEVAMTQMGGHAIFADFKVTKIAQGETLADTAKTLSRYCDAIMARLYRQSDLETLAKNASIPVINGLTELYHPCQTVADLLTVKEKFGKIEGLTAAFVGDCGFNMCHSTIIGFSKLGVNVKAVCPNKDVYKPRPEVLEKAKKQAIGDISIIHDPIAGVRGADIVFTDTWVSPGQEEEYNQRMMDLKPYQINAELMKHAKKDAIFMHCLPAFRGFEVTDEVIDGPQSVVFDEAENRLHTEKAILFKLLGR